MRHRTAVIVAALVLLICARMPAWSGAAVQALAGPAATPPGMAGLHIQWEPAAALRRWLGTIYGTGRELMTWL